MSYNSEKARKIFFSFPFFFFLQICCCCFFHTTYFLRIVSLCYIALLYINRDNMKCVYSVQKFLFSFILANIYQKLLAHEFNLSSYVIMNGEKFGNKCFWTIFSQPFWWYVVHTLCHVIEFQLFWKRYFNFDAFLSQLKCSVWRSMFRIV